MTVYVIGNPDFELDNAPQRMLPALRTAFPTITFTAKDPNEEWDISSDLFIIDTVEGVDRVTVFHNLENFARSPRVSLHDFDAFAQLSWLQKIGQLPPLTIIGVPNTLPLETATKDVVELLQTSLQVG